ncbi:response regulator [Oscillatoriales cyanobacterium LEGE 11467]|uniref:Response regulator n=1 Tax=Zarconia navalis LEGE 11467 TaxID=1828826 RepID=A0A928VVJ3_9CYAN|nr:response regulator [Zarconia navalis]MBE9041022.1 response regulator [Zarconia navalis LEGE 11467]
MTEAVILCVDDEVMILDSLQEQISRHFGDRFLYEAAESGEEALEILEELNEEGINIVLIVSDWLMPEMRGDEFLIRVHQQFNGITKILLTGQADQEAIERATQEANLYGCIYKPWREENLIEIIKKSLKLA